MYSSPETSRPQRRTLSKNADAAAPGEQDATLSIAPGMRALSNISPHYSANSSEQAQFRDRYQPGDLVYGLGKIYIEDPDASPRYRYSQLPQFEATREGAWTIDQYPVVEEELGKGNVPKPKYLDHFIGALKQHNKYGKILDSVRDRGKTWKRKCKAGLHWATHSEEPIIYVHFILDGLDVENALNKKPPYGDSVTASELRWLYRNRSDQQVRDRVQFWHQERPVMPPWTREYAADLVTRAFEEGCADGDFEEEDRDEYLERGIERQLELWSSYKPRSRSSGAR